MWRNEKLIITLRRVYPIVISVLTGLITPPVLWILLPLVGGAFLNNHALGSLGNFRIVGMPFWVAAYSVGNICVCALVVLRRNLSKTSVVYCICAVVSYCITMYMWVSGANPSE